MRVPLAVSRKTEAGRASGLGALAGWLGKLTLNAVRYYLAREEVMSCALHRPSFCRGLGRLQQENQHFCEQEEVPLTKEDSPI